jgi:hypothetical protein
MNRPTSKKLIRRPLLLPMLAFQACATNGNSCLVWGSHLPILSAQYLANGVQPGSEAEKQIQRVNERWAANFN